MKINRLFILIIFRIIRTGGGVPSVSATMTTSSSSWYLGGARLEREAITTSGSGLLATSQSHRGTGTRSVWRAGHVKRSPTALLRCVLRLGLSPSEMIKLVSSSLMVLSSVWQGRLTRICLNIIQFVPGLKGDFTIMLKSTNFEFNTVTLLLFC